MLYLDIVRVCSWLVNPLYILVFKLNNSWNRHIYHVWHLWNLAIIIEEKLISKNAVGFRGHWVSNSECGLIPVIIQITCRITVQTIWLKILCIVRHYSEILVDLFIIHYAGSMGQWKGVEVGGGHQIGVAVCSDIFNHLPWKPGVKLIRCYCTLHQQNTTGVDSHWCQITTVSLYMGHS